MTDPAPPIPAPAAFGCPSCFQGDAAAVWLARPFQPLAQLVDESHFSLVVMACRACGQHCVKVFTEFVDWQAGDDAQYWYLIPLTPDEVRELTAQGENVSTQRLEALSQNRPILQADYPTGRDKRILWSVGPVMIMRGS